MKMKIKIKNFYLLLLYHYVACCMRNTIVNDMIVMDNNNDSLFTKSERRGFLFIAAIFSYSGQSHNKFESHINQ